MAKTIVTQADLSKLTAFLISQNREGVKLALTRNGYKVPADANDKDLYNFLADLSKANLDAYWKVVGATPIDRNKVTEQQLSKIGLLFGGNGTRLRAPNPNVREWYETALDYILPTNVSVGGGSHLVETITPSVKTGAVIAVTIIGVIAIAVLGYFYMKKSTT